MVRAKYQENLGAFCTVTGPLIIRKWPGFPAIARYAVQFVDGREPPNGHYEWWAAPDQLRPIAPPRFTEPAHEPEQVTA